MNDERSTVNTIRSPNKKQSIISMSRIALIGLLILATVLARPVRKSYTQYLGQPAVVRLRRYIQIDTSRVENLKYGVEFWRNQAEELKLPFAVYRPGGLPIVVITVPGLNPLLPSIMLNSHMDVVPAYEDEWTYAPYAALMDEEGNIYGRGTQDTKDVGLQYLEAVRRLLEEKILLQRTLHLTIMPDEELGGYKGIKPFMDTEEFRALNIGFALDEGYASSNNNMFVFYQDKRPWQFQVTVYAPSGHGSGMPNVTAIEKITGFIDNVNNYRRQMRRVVDRVDQLDYGAYTSVNVNIVKGGTATNIIPSKFSATVDMRLATDCNVTEIEKMIHSWVRSTGNDSTIKFLRKDMVSAKTNLDDGNPYWVAFQSAMVNLGIRAIPVVAPATTDMLVMRNRGFPAIGFAPKSYTTPRAHAKDEYIHVETYLFGIHAYTEILKNVANLPHQEPANYNEKCNTYDQSLNDEGTK